MMDEKFSTCIINEFEFINDLCRNYYILVTNKQIKEYKYITKTDYVRLVSPSNFLECLSEIHCDVLILHNLESLPYHIIPKLEKRIKVVWFAWGYDLYTPIGKKPFIEIPHLYHNQTYKVIKNTSRLNLKKYCRTLYRLWINKDVLNAVKRIDFFSGVLPLEYELMKMNPFFKAKQVLFRYKDPTLITDWSLLEVPPVTGNNIMIGNSGDPSNNHLDIFYLLKKQGISGRKVVVPLSYGGTPTYIKYVKKVGREFWGNDFISLDTYMPITQYKSLLSSCYYRLFGHERQQAIGNINMALKDGCKVFMYRTSMGYKFYNSIGIRIYSLEDNLYEELSSSLTDGQVLAQRTKAIGRDLTSNIIKILNDLIKILEVSFEK